MIDFYSEYVSDGYGTVTIGEWGDYLIQIMPMIYNNRLVMTPKNCPVVYDYGWCYPKGKAAWMAAALWDPETDDEPPAYIKAICPGRRAPKA